MVGCCGSWWVVEITKVSSLWSLMVGGVTGKLQGDIALMKEIGLDFFRFSSHGPEYYQFKTFITLFHWDVPQALEEEYGGFLSQNIVLLKWEKLAFQPKPWYVPKYQTVASTKAALRALDFMLGW
ncbi:raucaffricine-o-beta-d-glucosidase [Quercus suber]|uniref:Raucaffricine-o-beta-d-glucosidase n=1 Tax=Quercus suber TaxID=58331 RepID=A0AAW0L823_QUESU